MAKSISGSVYDALNWGLLGHLMPKHDDIVCGIGGSGVTSRTVWNLLDLGERRRATDSDLRQIVLDLRHKSYLRSRVTLGVEAQSWRVDGLMVGKDPRVIDGSTIEVEAKATAVGARSLAALKEALNMAWPPPPLDIWSWHFMFEPVAASRSVLKPLEFAAGATVVDVGAESSGIAIWRNGRIISAEGVIRGFNQMVRDVAFDLGLPFEEVRPLADSEDAERQEWNERKKLREDVDRLLESTCWDFADYVAEELIERGVVLSELPSQIVLVGGYSNIRRLVDPFTARFERDVRIGLPAGIEGFPVDAGPEKMTAWCTSCGLALSSIAFRQGGSGSELDAVDGLDFGHASLM